MKQPPLIAITMRVDSIPARDEVRDALDQSWIRFFITAGARPLLIPNGLDDPAGYMRSMGASGLVISGGNDLSSRFPTHARTPAQVKEVEPQDVQPLRDHSESLLLAASTSEGWPVLGVCRGMQVLNIFHGGVLETIPGHVRTKHNLTRLGQKGCFTFDEEVNSFHGYGIPLSGLGAGFVPMAQVGEYAEAIWNKKLRQLGVMWHPERNSPFSANDLSVFQQLFGIPSD